MRHRAGQDSLIVHTSHGHASAHMYIHMIMYICKYLFQLLNFLRQVPRKPSMVAHL